MDLDFRGKIAPNGAVMFDTSGQSIMFYQRMVLVPFETEQQGREVYRPADFIRIATPGEHDEIDREATPADIARNRERYLAYKSGLTDIPNGTPLTVLFAQNPEIVDGLKYHKCHTVEQLASVNDHGAQNLPLGGADWIIKAKRYLAMTKDAGRFGAIEARQRDLDFQNEKLREDKERLEARLAELEASSSRRGSGRPRKTAMDEMDEAEAEASV